MKPETLKMIREAYNFYLSKFIDEGDQSAEKIMIRLARVYLILTDRRIEDEKMDS
jgi:hypothetical protein